MGGEKKVEGTGGGGWGGGRKTTRGGRKRSSRSRRGSRETKLTVDFTCERGSNAKLDERKGEGKKGGKDGQTERQRKSEGSEIMKWAWREAVGQIGHTPWGSQTKK